VQPVDETTVVQPRDTLPYEQPIAEQSALASIRPWRIMVPAAVVLIAVFGIVFLLTRSTGQTPPSNLGTNQPGLVADPNSQPVQPMGPPTGEGEHSIQSQTSASPTPRNANANLNSTELPPAAVTGEFGANENSNSSGRNRNANQRESPTPKASPTVGKEQAPPPPKPSPTVKSLPKSTVTPADK
jgi:hypothetical protein